MAGPWARRVGYTLAGLAGLAGALAIGGWWTWQRQGLDELHPPSGASVTVDEHGVPTIAAQRWEALPEAQGYVVAASRLWQMDLMRRASGGRLSEWFGAPAIEADRARRLEDWPGVAERLADALPADERQTCDDYARGVNAFIAEAEGRWGVEYVITRTHPEPWRCADSMLLLLSMASDLSSQSDNDLLSWSWRATLPADWARFLFPETHPWNIPLFGAPDFQSELPTTALGAGAPTTPAAGDPGMTPGSNSWAWRGQTGAFVANDPHLGARVPHLWFLARLYVSPTEWVAGTTIPGIPGVVLGMNAHVAWAFTNTGEDVDDLLIEQVSDDGERYVSGALADASGVQQPVWSAVEHRRSTILVKGQDPVTVDARFVGGRPLRQADGPHGKVWLSRQWLPFQDPARVTGLPGMLFARAHDLDELQGAIDHFRFPAQNVIAMDRAGTLLYRTSGLGVQRRVDGAQPQPALEAAWAGLESVDQRPRLLIPADAPAPVHLETANSRIWVGPWHERWDGDRRVARIRELLSRPDLTQADMERFQLDTRSRHHQILLEWAAARHPPRDGGEEAMIARWRAWDGVAAADPQTFTEALAVEDSLSQTLLDAVRRQWMPPALKHVPYEWSRDDVWLLETLGVADAASETSIDWQIAETKAGFDRFGLDEAEVATATVRAASNVRELYPARNRWAAQHPFVGRVPVLGPLFAIPTPEQLGWPDLVRVERPTGGASARMVWNLYHPEQSSWITPVGQSGHVRSPHYADLQPIFQEGARVPVFDADHDWGF